MPDPTRIQSLFAEHFQDRIARRLDNLLPSEAVVEYLRVLCPSEGDLMLFSENAIPDTNTGKFVAVTKSQVALLHFGAQGNGAGPFLIEGPIYPFAAVKSVLFDSNSTADADAENKTVIIPSVVIRLDSGEEVGIGDRAEYGWTPRSVPDSNTAAQAASCAAFLSRLLG